MVIIVIVIRIRASLASNARRAQLCKIIFGRSVLREAWCVSERVCAPRHGLRHRLDHPAAAQPGPPVELRQLHHRGRGRAVQQVHPRVPEQDDGVQQGAADGSHATAGGRAAHHRVQPPLVLRRPRPLGRAGLRHAGGRRRAAHALVAGGARHLLHQRAARRLLRARQVRARAARRRRLPAGDRLLHRAADARRVGAHLPRGPRQRRQGAHPLQVGRGAHDMGVLAGGARAPRAARVARGHGRRAAQPRALPSARAQPRRARRGRARAARRAAVPVKGEQRERGGDPRRHHGARATGATAPARRHARRAAPPARRARSHYTRRRPPGRPARPARPARADGAPAQRTQGEGEGAVGGGGGDAPRPLALLSSKLRPRSPRRRFLCSLRMPCLGCATDSELRCSIARGLMVDLERMTTI